MDAKTTPAPEATAVALLREWLEAEEVLREVFGEPVADATDFAKRVRAFLASPAASDYVAVKREEAVAVREPLLRRMGTLHDPTCYRYKQGLIHTTPEDCNCWYGAALAIIDGWLKE